MTNGTRMSSAELRTSFVEFFVERGHLHVPSASLVPAEMATTLFTIAGMEPFVPNFLGEVPAPARRAVSVQRCLRVAGAKSDIENVGRTGRHGTFLEMLGNFAFADYGKREAIAMAWEYITKRLKIDPERLYITVHTGDDEAQEIWEREIGIPAARISRFDEDNFWTMGPTGPCGPSTEIFYDTGPDHAEGPNDTGPNLGNRYVEIWNLVFQQFNREADGRLRELPSLNIDTGAGLERILAVVNGHWSMYETDLFTDLVAAQPPIGASSLPVPEQFVRQCIIADHARAVTTLIADGVYPSNADRGYVLRFLIRRAIRNGRLLGYPAGFLTNLVPSVVKSLKSGFSGLVAAEKNVMSVLGREEDVFERTLERGEALLDKRITDLRAQGKTELAGVDAFMLHDTFGFPFELTREILGEANLTVDLPGFTQEMEVQRTRARSDAAKKRGVVSVGATARVGQTSEFHGYDGLEADGRILEILTEEGTPVDEAIVGERVRIVLDRSSFYAERGGQIGDHGVLFGFDDARFLVDDTQVMGDAIVHHGIVQYGTFEHGQSVHSVVDAEWRREIRRHHTSAHLLQYALREVLGSDVAQAGSWVGPERMRFDFRSPGGALTPEQRQRAAEIINSIIRDDTEVVTREVSIAEARSLGAISMAGENYGERVRVLQAGPSLEFCGGTHAHRTGELGLFILLSESSVGSGIRRIEGLVSQAAEHYVTRQQELLSKLTASLTARPEELLERIERLQSDVRERDREIGELRIKAAGGEARQLIEAGEQLGGCLYVGAHIEGAGAEELKTLTQAMKARMNAANYILVLFGSQDQRVTLTVLAGDVAVKSGANAGALIRTAAPLIDGKGGGSAAQAQGGGTLASGIPKALSAIREALEASIKSAAS
jgi:alanyl-tRNA synthetase